MTDSDIWMTMKETRWIAVLYDVFCLLYISVYCIQRATAASELLSVAELYLNLTIVIVIKKNCRIFRHLETKSVVRTISVNWIRCKLLKLTFRPTRQKHLFIINNVIGCKAMVINITSSSANADRTCDRVNHFEPNFRLNEWINAWQTVHPCSAMTNTQQIFKRTTALNKKETYSLRTLVRPTITVTYCYQSIFIKLVFTLYKQSLIIPGKVSLINT